MNAIRRCAHTCRIIGRATSHLISGIKDSIVNIQWKEIPKGVWDWYMVQSWWQLLRLAGYCLLLYSPMLVMAPALYSASTGGNGNHAGIMSIFARAMMDPLQTTILFAVLRAAVAGGFGLAAVAWGIRAAAMLRLVTPIVWHQVRTRFLEDNAAAAGRRKGEKNRAIQTVSENGRKTPSHRKPEAGREGDLI
ncbi:hypothetical protein K490DRAFT_61285 [Saccharata proteae CBS 121410]|uniref:Uncharacterized protein n=1 Tax=Saccharata proteae CBS 121410 TaxID=1314787 RepID=A0A9P4I1N1_9PEZI|nr:hypothetical protein K490DRAFT_61285 [Saccharata proteae CBS 121410]